MEISAADVKALRDKTGAGMMDCKKALADCKGDTEAAIEQLRKMGQDAAVKRMGREAAEGLVEAYIHPGGRIGVLVEVNCETDFVARTDDFKAFVRDLAMQIAAAGPLVVRREELDEALVEKERKIYREIAIEEKKPENVIDRIVEGRLQKYYKEVVLLEQEFVKDLTEKKKRTIEQLLKEKAGSLGENIVIRRFARFQLGESGGDEVGGGEEAPQD